MTSVLREDEKPDAKPYADTDQHHPAIELHLLPPMFTTRDGSIQLLLMTLMLLAQLLPEGIPSLVLALKLLAEALLLLMMVLEYHGMVSEQNSRR